MPRLLPRVAPEQDQPHPLGTHQPGTRGPRTVHPWAWWGWALSAGAAVSVTTNPLVFMLVAGAVVVVVVLRRPHAGWAHSLRVYLVLAAVIVTMRLFFQILLGGLRSGHVLFTLPSVSLPSWAAGITLGGPVTLEGLGYALFDALRLAAMLLCVGAANSLANPRTALKSVPAALRDISTAVVIALALVPQLISSVHRVRRGQRLRGGRRRGAAALPGTLIPVIEDSVEGSLQLATSMEVRGYGRTRRPGQRRLGSWQLLVALVAIVLASYVLLAVPSSSPGPLGFGAAVWLAVGLLAVGAALSVWGMRIAGSQLGITRYRPAAWGAPERLTLGCGLGALVIMVWLASPLGSPDAMNPPVPLLTWPGLPPLALFATMALLIPGLATPDPNRAA